jgi:hypothetical protein
MCSQYNARQKSIAIAALSLVSLIILITSYRYLKELKACKWKDQTQYSNLFALQQLTTLAYNIACAKPKMAR